MQVFGNVASDPVRRESKTTKTGYWEFRVGESQRGVDASTSWYTVRAMKDIDTGLAKGDFVRVTGKLKTDFYLSREGKPTGTLLIIAFEATKISKHAAAADEPKEKGKEPEKEPVKALVKAAEPVRAEDATHQFIPIQTATWADW